MLPCYSATLAFVLTRPHMAALVFYEYAITIGLEVQQIWSREVSVATVLFILTRYITLLDSLFAVIPVLTSYSFEVSTKRDFRPKNSQVNGPLSGLHRPHMGASYHHLDAHSRNVWCVGILCTCLSMMERLPSANPQLSLRFASSPSGTATGGYSRSS